MIEFLSHRSNAIKANAAAYLQHLCYMDDNIKAKTRSVGEGEAKTTFVAKREQNAIGCWGKGWKIRQERTQVQVTN